MLTMFGTKSNRVKGVELPQQEAMDPGEPPQRRDPALGLPRDDYMMKVWNYKLHRCLFTLLGHLDYIRTVQFHHESPWIVSSSDDQTIRIWNWQSQDLVVSASLDQTVRVWDIGALRKKTASPADDILRLSQMNTDFFGGVDAVVKYVLEGHDCGVNWGSFHPTLPLLISGADDRQVKTCPLACVGARVQDRFWILASHPETNLFAAGHDSGMIVFKLKRERPAFSVSGDSLYYVKDRFLRFFDYSTQKDTQVIPIRRPGSISLNQGAKTLSFSPTEDAVLICSDIVGASYELYIIPKDSWVESSNQVLVKNLKNEIVKKSALTVATDSISYAGPRNLLCMAEDRVVIFDLQFGMVLRELQTSFVRYVVWSNDMESIVLLSKHSVVLADRKLVHRCTLHETIRIKSGAWDDNGVFMYTTLTHIKYCLPNGDSGIIKKVDVPELCGQAMIAYLQQKGFPEVALHFVKDERTRFNLVLESGNIEIAVASAKVIDEKDHWYRSGVEALRQGNAGIVEYAYQRTKNFERLSFLYLITGNLDNLSKMMKIAEQKSDVMGQFHNALYLGDDQERVKILENAALVHGLQGVAERLAADLGDNVPVLPEGGSASLLMPLNPILSGGDWPLLRVTKGIFEGGLDSAGRGVQEEYEDAADADWGEDLDIVDVVNMHNGDVSVALEGEDVDEQNDEGGWDYEDLELPPDVDTPKTATNARSSMFVAPPAGLPVSHIWVQKSSLAAEHAAAGNFDTAMRLLNRQLGIRNFAPLKTLFTDLHMGSHMYLLGFSSAPVISVVIERGWSESASPNVRGPPALAFNFSPLEDKLEAGYKATTAGKFTEALHLFLGILHTIPLIVVESRRELDKVKELITIAKEYVLGSRMELKRREMKDNPVREQELTAYFTHCNLQVPHLRLALLSALTVCYKAGNLNTAANFARRLLETNPTNENQTRTARRVLQAAAERNMKDASELNYDFRNPFVVCGATYVPIYRG
ncbi:hypothetical protein RJ639_021911 [Escallonia herrerae]|uniref:Coatomer subunit alpha n=1 Tax=Escallonia herrerae TaxID=1293975 RepID=A0AA89AHL7_9ASTE|nr:hypothetical protein RJ639_021911 [Escallonia herrerae]